MRVEFISLSKAPKPHKYMVKLRIDGKDKTVRFGASGYDDFTTTRSESKKKAYLARHKPRENWTRSGVTTAGFWSRWILWNLPTIKGSLESTLRRFRISKSKDTA